MGGVRVSSVSNIYNRYIQRGIRLAGAALSDNPEMSKAALQVAGQTALGGIWKGAAVMGAANMARYGYRNYSEGRSWHDGLIGAGFRGALAGIGPGAGFGMMSLGTRNHAGWKGFRQSFMQRKPGQYETPFTRARLNPKAAPYFEKKMPGIGRIPFGDWK